MSKTANKTAIGAFVAGALVLLFVAIAVFGSGSLFQSTTRYVLFFDSSIKGLSIGSPVMFRGVPVGRVIEIQLFGSLKDMIFQTPVFIELDEKVEKSFAGPNPPISREEYFDRLIAHGFRASLTNQSLLTGQLMIELNFYPPNELPSRLDKAQFYEGVLEIPTIPSKLDDMMQKAFKLPYEQITANILSITEELNRLLKSPDVQQIAHRANLLLDRLNTLSEDVELTLKDVRALMEPYALLASTTEKRVDSTLDEAIRFLKTVNSVADEIKRTMADARAVLNKNSPTVLELNQAIRELTDTARAVRVLANTLERNPESILRGK